MAVIRRNILTSMEDRDQYIAGVKALKNEFLGPTSEQFFVSGANTPLSTYDLFVIWHHITMNIATPPDLPLQPPFPVPRTTRNAAHGGPVFLPWHRLMLLLFESALQRVLGDETFALPYWDWATDGEGTLAEQKASRLWDADCMGGDGTPISTGPFAFDPSDPTGWRVRLHAIPLISNGTIQFFPSVTERGLAREFARPQPPGAGSTPVPPPTLPRKANIQQVLNEPNYDQPNWDVSSNGFRNLLEGWDIPPLSNYPVNHNLIHVWVGGDMGPSTSPNDPVFFLNHCYVDLVWEQWMQRHGRVYTPEQNESEQLFRHRIDDPLFTIFPFSAADTPTPRKMLDVSDLYVYDVLMS